MEQKFIEVLKDALEIQDHEVLMDDAFRSYPEWDSLAQLTLIATLDEEYGVTIEMSQFNELITVKELCEAVKSHLA